MDVERKKLEVYNNYYNFITYNFITYNYLWDILDQRKNYVEESE